MRFFNALNLLLAAKFLSQTPFFKFLPNHFSVSLFFLPDQYRGGILQSKTHRSDTTHSAIQKLLKIQNRSYRKEACR